jgi:hypothetical protein
MGRGAQDPDPATGVLDHDEDVVGHAGQGGRREEVARDDGLGLSAQEG